MFRVAWGCLGVRGFGLGISAPFLDAGLKVGRHVQGGPQESLDGYDEVIPGLNPYECSGRRFLVEV